MGTKPCNLWIIRGGLRSTELSTSDWKLKVYSKHYLATSLDNLNNGFQSRQLRTLYYFHKSVSTVWMWLMVFLFQEIHIFNLSRVRTELLLCKAVNNMIFLFKGSEKRDFIHQKKKENLTNLAWYELFCYLHRKSKHKIQSEHLCRNQIGMLILVFRSRLAAADYSPVMCFCTYREACEFQSKHPVSKEGWNLTELAIPGILCVLDFKMRLGLFNMILWTAMWHTIYKIRCCWKLKHSAQVISYNAYWVEMLSALFRFSRGGC